MTNSTLSRPVAPVVFLGIQEGLPATASSPGIPSIELWNLTAPLGEYPVGSTISKKTINDAGYQTPTEAAAAAREVQLRRQRVKDSHQPFSNASFRLAAS